ncbi:MAG: PKD domain-containing protein [Gammaproteobacteria bacterium]|nr:PKD domain-containing protein [Gammaproteobacteria bacterium]
MRPKLRPGSCAALAAGLLCLPGCGGDAGLPRVAPVVPSQAPAQTNRRPIADAGPPQRAREGDNVVLNGTGSRDPDGTIVSYRWTPRVDNEVTVILENAETATPSFTVPELEEDTTFVFDLVVVDDRGDSSADAAEVFVTTYDDM